ncbi:hypothetical protein [Pontibacter ramchanderi]|uniref:SpoIIAA-like protein n=1 Tax=Pontibacter ramchanderi TaxID=1179743 RepID=A0A2N3U6R2_9BACT|nr:hypothetical protein [Pontibacter ramchanderi]PKV62427.1 hypothetical protein BD749_3839 [Pontibacter ramchanderi]
MLLHRDGLIELNYDPATDILSVSWPDINIYSRTQITYSFAKLREVIAFYDIKKLLIDSRFNQVLIDEEAYSELIRELHGNLRSTRLAMTARLGSLTKLREEKAKQHAKQLIDELKPSFAFRNFDDAGMALQWLKAG